MIISHRKKFIFIHNPKVAGTSIRSCLKQYNCHSFLRCSFSDKLNILSGRYPKIYSKNFWWHLRLNEIKEALPSDIFETYYKFGFVRNPWYREVSLYNYILKRESHKNHHVVKSISGFDNYIKWRTKTTPFFQKDFFYIGGNTKVVNFIGKLENIKVDLKSVFDKLDIKNTGLDKLNTGNVQSYESYYSKNSFEIIKKHYCDDIDLFDYDVSFQDFETGIFNNQ